MDFYTLIIIIVILIPALIKYYKRKNNRQLLIEKLDLKKNYFYVRCSTQSRFKRKIKFYPWEYSGVLYIEDIDSLSFYYLDDSNNIKEEKFEISDCKIEWVGRDILINGLISWFLIEKDSKLYYFTSETGALINYSKSRTKKIYNSIKNSNFS